MDSTAFVSVSDYYRGASTSDGVCWKLKPHQLTAEAALLGGGELRRRQIVDAFG